ncbi:unnamed protein product [Notodromas monacha]|uniref:Reelin domain-containing protein n=1 Tax=Notodromas monacha TaxID=399045 RepID=A0A7R9GHL6_9CRUS|nr:unnamed protein product [Notodromas monacha]CAG0921480.1 unnamed protein product [Notodromas monacha]
MSSKKKAQGRDSRRDVVNLMLFGCHFRLCVARFSALMLRPIAHVRVLVDCLGRLLPTDAVFPRCSLLRLPCNISCCYSHKKLNDSMFASLLTAWDAVTHSNKREKRRVSVRWKAPIGSSGEVSFRSRGN